MSLQTPVLLASSAGSGQAWSEAELCCVPTDSRPTGAMRATHPAFGDAGWSAQPFSVFSLVRPEGELWGDTTWPVMARSSSALHELITVAEPVTHQGWQRVVFEFYCLVLAGLVV